MVYFLDSREGSTGSCTVADAAEYNEQLRLRSPSQGAHGPTQKYTLPAPAFVPVSFEQPQSTPVLTQTMDGPCSAGSRLPGALPTAMDSQLASSTSASTLTPAMGKVQCEILPTAH